MASSKNARCTATALLLLAVLLISCSGMGSAARGLEETETPPAPEDDNPAEAPPAPEDDYPAEAPETPPEEEQTSSFPEFAMPPIPGVELPPFPEMPAIPGFHFSEPQQQQEADEP